MTDRRDGSGRECGQPIANLEGDGGLAACSLTPRIGTIPRRPVHGIRSVVPGEETIY